MYHQFQKNAITICREDKYSKNYTTTTHHTLLELPFSIQNLQVSPVAVCFLKQTFADKEYIDIDIALLSLDLYRFK